MLRVLIVGTLLLTLVPTPAARAQGAADDAWKDLLAQALSQDNAGDYPRAEKLFQQALHEAERFGPDDPRVANTLNSLAVNYRHQKKFADEDSALRRALGIIQQQNDENSEEVADATFNLASAMVDGEHQAAAVPLIQQALEDYETSLGGFNIKTAAALCLLGDSYRALHNFADAERPLRRCADIRETSGGLQSNAFADALHSLALAYEGEGKLALAEPRFTLAEKIREKTLGITSPVLARTMEDHAVLLKQMGRDEEAARLRTMAAAILRANERASQKK